MSRVLIQQYLADLDRLKKVGASDREGVVSEAFKDLLKGYARAHDLVFVPQYEIESPAKERRYVDGALLHGLRLPFGYWEAKDSKDDLDKEIEVKFRRGYPKDNILFDDSREAVLIQNGRETMRCAVDDVERLEKLLSLFFGYERPEIAEFRKAVEQFRADLPKVLEALREMIEHAHAGNEAFRKAAATFLDTARHTINPNLTDADVREILIQHILTDEIFDEVFPGQPFHKDNNVARELHKLEDTFFTGNTKFQTLKALEVYYRAIRSAAARIGGHHEKQTFLKIVYENFYKVYNPKAADRLGVVYTPNEIVRFMIESADWLCEQHFDRNLIDRDVEILDPATGTGTFICELIEHFRGQPAKLRHKYEQELHANEVAILPYYVANLNIEATYASVAGDYREFPGLCLVDTLDNVAGLRKRTGDQVADLFGMGEENVERIKRQNRRKISVIIGNPPYNANQLNENENNKNREYPDVDDRIRESYLHRSTAKKTKLYDMYVRFVRWASDRLHEDGVLAFVSNNSFIDAQGFDGFRAELAREFNELTILNLKGAARGSGEPRRRQGGNIFSDQIRVGVAIWFAVRKKGGGGCRIRYLEAPDFTSSEEKREFLRESPLRVRDLADLRPTSDNYWTPIEENDFGSLMPIVERLRKNRKRSAKPKAVFQRYGLGVSTNRDDWLYGTTVESVATKVAYFASILKQHLPGSGAFDPSIKWSETLKRRAEAGLREVVDQSLTRRAAYRPFTSRWLYQSTSLIDRPGGALDAFPIGVANRSICFSDVGYRSGYVVLAVDGPADLHFGAAVDGYQQLPFRLVGEDGALDENITNWALNRFKERYVAAKGRQARPITKEAVFQYVYGVLHDPVYREKYVQNLKREFPRIPFYPDFWQWADWGRELMGLHIGYESIEPWPLARADIPDEKSRVADLAPKAMLKADTATGRVILDSETTLTGVPAEAWDYRLGNRSALEWILDQHKERTPKDPTIRAKFNTYRFADHKEKVVDLLQRVTRVSVETQRIVDAMRSAPH